MSEAWIVRDSSTSASGTAIRWPSACTITTFPGSAIGLTRPQVMWPFVVTTVLPWYGKAMISEG